MHTRERIKQAMAAYAWDLDGSAIVRRKTLQDEAVVYNTLRDLLALTPDGEHPLEYVRRLVSLAIKFAESTIKTGHYGEHRGWWDSMNDADIVAAGDFLVEQGLWERDDERGEGNRQWYRPIRSAECKGGES